jgi:DNA-binding response OmpR family regulator
VIDAEEVADLESPSSALESPGGDRCKLESAMERGATSMDSVFSTRLRFYILDDSATSRRIVEHHLLRLCPGAAVRTFGAQEADVELFTASAVDDADVVILDQHLEYSETFFGTAIVRRLLRMGYGGLVCIRSSDTSPDDVAQYTAAGAHCWVGKEAPGPEMVERLKAAYVELRRTVSSDRQTSTNRNPSMDTMPFRLRVSGVS